MLPNIKCDLNHKDESENVTLWWISLRSFRCQTSKNVINVNIDTNSLNELYKSPINVNNIIESGKKTMYVGKMFQN